MESEQTAELAAALAKAQAAMGPAVFNKVNPHFKNRYADLAAVFSALKPFHENGISFTCATQFREGTFLLRTTMRHSTGQWIAADYPLPLNAKPQEIGSALTYARRYSLSALAGVAADEDDDGEATRKTNGNGHATEHNADTLQAMTDTLDKASKNGMDALKAAWIKLPKEARDTLNAALERRFKPTAAEVDAAKSAESQQ